MGSISFLTGLTKQSWMGGAGDVHRGGEQPWKRTQGTRPLSRCSVPPHAPVTEMAPSLLWSSLLVGLPEVDCGLLAAMGSDSQVRILYTHIFTRYSSPHLDMKLVGSVILLAHALAQTLLGFSHAQMQWTLLDTRRVGACWQSDILSK